MSCARTQWPRASQAAAKLPGSVNRRTMKFRWRPEAAHLTGQSVVFGDRNKRDCELSRCQSKDMHMRGADRTIRRVVTVVFVRCFLGYNTAGIDADGRGYILSQRCVGMCMERAQPKHERQHKRKRSNQSPRDVAVPLHSARTTPDVESRSSSPKSQMSADAVNALGVTWLSICLIGVSTGHKTAANSRLVDWMRRVEHDKHRRAGVNVNGPQLHIGTYLRRAASTSVRTSSCNCLTPKDGSDLPLTRNVGVWRTPVARMSAMS